ncbi:hypothetical protein Pla100_17690 [Neorhodopirellula pilleata]|uniref:Trm112p-like protein n=2 Tax=Neorhodopirellula pilleata TaxID=2714738 RepID=A0A5C6APS7_9BACT|nr:hypothetical protein Pla100_17690 [Neorhodopirellula pilleata]
MTITPDILPILRCPAGGGPLTLADAELIERINEQIAAGTARDQLDARVETPVDGGLVTANADRLYPIRENIPTLIADDAIRL